MSFYDAYFSQQYGGGCGNSVSIGQVGGRRGVESVFVGARGQRGHGLGSFFTGLFRSALPFIARGARAVGKEALRAGIGVIDDVGEGDYTLKDSLKNRLAESGKTLRRKATKKMLKLMDGSGYITHARRRRIGQSQSGGRKRRIVSRVSKRPPVRRRRRCRRRGVKQTSRRKNIKHKS